MNRTTVIRRRDGKLVLHDYGSPDEWIVFTPDDLMTDRDGLDGGTTTNDWTLGETSGSEPQTDPDDWE